MTPKNDFEREVISFMSRIDEHMENQNRRCDSHSERMKAHEDRMGKHEDRTGSLEKSREYAKGWLKAIGVGLPALGSLAWAIFEVIKYAR